MTDSNSLLFLYEELVQNHASQFDSEIASLQQLVKTRMQELRGLEQTLVGEQREKVRSGFGSQLHPYILNKTWFFSCDGVTARRRRSHPETSYIRPRFQHLTKSRCSR
jgi:hypothetical protein